MPAPVIMNTYRIEGDVAYLDVSTRAHPDAVTRIALRDLDKVIDGLGRWYAYKNSERPEIYVRRSITVGGGKQQSQMLHKFLAQEPGCPVVLHIDFDGLNNLRENLKPSDRHEQAAHARHAKGKYRGVFERPDNRRYRAIIGIDGELVHLGTYGSESDAAKAYDAAARAKYGALARLNFPSGPEGGA